MINWLVPSKSHSNRINHPFSSTQGILNEHSSYLFRLQVLASDYIFRMTTCNTLHYGKQRYTNILDNLELTKNLHLF